MCLHLCDPASQQVITYVTEIDTTHVPKPRNASATRDAILVAAGKEFTKLGFENASTRRIAEDAGCNVALINRYFGSKIGLFEEVMDACIDLGPVLEGTPDEAVLNLVEICLSKGEAASDFDPVLAAIRSGGTEPAKDVVQSQLGEPMVATLAAYIGGDDAQEKAGLMLSIVAGFDVGRRIIGAEAMQASQNPALRPHLTAAIRAVLEG